MLNGPRKPLSLAENFDVVLRKNYKLFQLGSSFWVAKASNLGSVSKDTWRECCDWVSKHRPLN